MSDIRKAFKGLALPPGAEEVITKLETKEREDEGFIEFLVDKLKKLENSSTESAIPSSAYRKEWEQSRNQAEGSRGAHLDEVKEKILIFLSNRDDAEVEQVAHGVSVGVPVAQFHLDEMQEALMVRAAYAIDSPVYWSLDHEGRGYLIKHGLIS